MSWYSLVRVEVSVSQLFLAGMVAVVFSVVFGWSRNIIIKKYQPSKAALFLVLWLARADFYLDFLSIPVGISGLLVSLLSNLGYMRQKEN